jgi:hypothetical protein
MKNAFAADHVVKSPQLRSSPNGSNPAIEVDVGGGAGVAVAGLLWAAQQALAGVRVRSGRQ